MSIIIITLFILGFIMGDLPNDIKWTTYTAHKSFGFTILMLFFVRLFVCRLKTPPKLKDQGVCDCIIF